MTIADSASRWASAARTWPGSVESSTAPASAYAVVTVSPRISPWSNVASSVFSGMVFTTPCATSSVT